MSGEGGAIAEVLAAHDDPPGWMWSASDQMVYACECGDHYVAGPIDVIQEHDVLAAAAWHREHIATALVASAALLALLAAERQRGREEALREAADRVRSRREAFLDSPSLDRAWIAGWHAAADDHAAALADVPDAAGVTA